MVSVLPRKQSTKAAAEEMATGVMAMMAVTATARTIN
jgi:hypothetical protein